MLMYLALIVVLCGNFKAAWGFPRESTYCMPCQTAQHRLHMYTISDCYI